MTITKLENIIEPEVFTPYVINKTMELSALIQSGIIENNEKFDELASGPSTLINMPFWEDLEGEEETVTQDGFYTPLNINANKDVARQQFIGNAWGANNLTSLLSGDDPMAAIGDRVADYWQRRMQARLLATLTGVFASTSMANKVLNISSTSGPDGLLSGNSFIDAGQLMGDAKELLTGVMMHSVTEAYLAKRQLIEYVQEAGQTDRIPYFMRKRVVVDDGVSYDTATKVGEMYLFGAGAIALGNGSHPDILETEVDRDSMSHAGEDYLINRKVFLLHPRGIKWEEEDVADEYPKRDELKKGDNWKRVYEEKQIRIVKHIFRID